jgi:hypothetical protein
VQASRVLLLLPWAMHCAQQQQRASRARPLGALLLLVLVLLLVMLCLGLLVGSCWSRFLLMCW